MARVMTDAQKAKAAAARAATIAQRSEVRSKVLRIGMWQIFQADPDNVVLRKGDDGDNSYYPSVAWALKGLLQKEITDAQATSIREVLAAVKSAEAKLVAAVASN